MIIKNVKWLKISGIIFIVAVLLFLGCYMLISNLNKEKIYVDAFANNFNSEIEDKNAVLVNSENPDSINFTNELAIIKSVNKTINLKFEYYLPNFSTIGFNTSERKNIDKQINKIKKLQESLEGVYGAIEGYYGDGQNLSETTTANIQNTFYKTYVKNYKDLLTEKNIFIKYLEKILEKHKITNTQYFQNLSNTSDVALYVGININIQHLIDQKLVDYSNQNTKTLLDQVNENLAKYISGNLSLTPTNYSNLLINHNKSNDKLLPKFEEFKTSLENLSAEDLLVMQEASLTNYITSTSNNDLINVYNFLKINGIYENSCKKLNSNAIALGLAMNENVE